MRVLGLAFFLCASCLSAGELENLRSGHPRVLLTDHGRWAELQKRSKTDAALSSMLKAMIAEAEVILEEEPAKREKIGRRLLSTSRSVLRRVSLSSAALAF